MFNLVRDDVWAGRERENGGSENKGLIGLFSLPDGGISFSRGGEPIKGAVYLGWSLVAPRREGETIDAAQEQRKLRAAAPLGANAYARHRKSRISFWRIPNDAAEKFYGFYLGKREH